MTKILFTSDLHLDDRFKNEYRWSIFGKLRETAENFGASAVAILGDITDAKDGHSSRLVNRMATEVRQLSEHFEVFILKGNHDYTDEKRPFFAFLDLLPNVTFAVEPAVHYIAGVPCLALPHAFKGQTTHGGNSGSDNIVTGMKVGKLLKEENFDMVLMHQTSVGSVLSNGTRVEHGVDLEPPKGSQHYDFYRNLEVPILSGDVHVPQQAGKVTYIGSPYPVVFGDDWPARFMLYDDGEFKSLPVTSIRKHSLTFLGPDSCKALPDDIVKGDQLKAKVMLSRDDIFLWPKLRSKIFDLAKEVEATVESLAVECIDSALVPGVRGTASPLELSPDKILDKYCDENSIEDELRHLGHELLDR